MRNVISVELVFENCEEVKLPCKAFGDFYVAGIEQHISRIASNAICRITRAKDIAIELYPECEQFADKSCLFDGISVFDRITKYNDITHINIVYEDGEEYISVDYDDNSNEATEAENINQKTYMSSCGVLYIVIAKGKGIFDYYDKELIEDQDKINFDKVMIGTIENDE